MTSEGENVWSAPLPVLSTDQPLFAFANVHYQLPVLEPVPFAQPTGHFAISSMLHSATPNELQAAKTVATDTTSPLIDDFKSGWLDWYSLSANNPHHWEYSTRKINDAKWQGQRGQQLALQVQSDHPNELIVVLTENLFRSYRGGNQEFVAVVKLAGGEKPQVASLTPNDFHTSEGGILSSWKNVDLLSLRAYFEKGGMILGSKS